MSKTVLKKHKPYNIQALIIREQFTGLQKEKNSPYLVHFKNTPNSHLRSIQKPPKRRLEEKRRTVCMLNCDYQDREPDGVYIKHVACRGLS